MFSADVVQGVKTAPVKGRLTPQEALDVMLTGTSLQAVRDQVTGAWSVKSRARQPAPAPEDRSTSGRGDVDEEAPLRLSPFTVVSEKEYGYRAANSITATGIGAEIYRTPIAISVVTSDLIRDLAAGSLREALLYTSSVTGDRRDPGSSGTGGSAMRGFATQLLVNRLSASVRNPVPFFVERVEIVKGPNAVFFGRVAPNGVLNVITLKPKAVTETTVQLSAGSYEFASAFIDHNQRLGDRVAIRLAGNWLDQARGFYDYTYRRSESGYGALRWDVLPNVSLNVTASIDHSKENKLSVSPRTNPAYIEFTRANPNSTLGLIQWGAQFVPPNTPVVTHYYNDLFDPFTVFPSGKRGNNNGPDAYQEDWNVFVQTELLAELGETFAARIAHAYGDNEFEILEHVSYPTFNGTWPNAAPNFRGTKSRGNTLEAELVAKFSALGMSHQVLLGGRLSYPRTGSFAAAGRAYSWNFLTQGPRRILRDGYPSGLPRPAVTYASGDERAVYAIDQISMAQDRLRVLAGVRRTEVSNNAGTAGAATLTQAEVTPQVGLFFEATPGWALFANYSRSFEPQFNVDAEGRLASNVQGEGHEFGVKFSERAGRFSGTASYFDLTREGEVRRDFTRETLTGRVPLFIPGGTQAARGAEFELHYSPRPNLQFVVNYTRLWDANITQDTTQPFIVGARLRNAPPYAGAVWTRYTVDTGAWRGLYFTAGARVSGEITPIVNALFSIRQPSYATVDSGIGFEGRLWGRPVLVGLNVKNLLDREYYDGQWTLADPRTLFLKLQTKF